jgi:hypothetical protein
MKHQFLGLLGKVDARSMLQNSVVARLAKFVWEVFHMYDLTGCRSAHNMPAALHHPILSRGIERKKIAHRTRFASTHRSVGTLSENLAHYLGT